MNRNKKSRSLHRSTPSVKAGGTEISSGKGGALNSGFGGKNLDIKANSTRELSDIGSVRAPSLDSVANCYENRSVDEEQANAMERDKIMSEEMSEIWQMAIPIEEAMVTERVMTLKHLLNLQVLSKITLRRYRIRVLDDAIIFPRFLNGDFPDGQSMKVSGLKICRLSELNGTLDDVQEEILPNANVFNGLFGYNLVQPTTKEIVIVGRESDSMAIYQATKHLIPSVVLPDAGGPLSYDAVPYLEAFSKTTFWFAATFYNRVKLFTRRLPMQRCFVVSPKISPFTPADLLVEGSITNGYDRIVKILGIAEIVVLRDIETFASLKETARDYVFGTGQVNGLSQWKRFPILNHYLKGFRLGELTIVSGPTGCGKTTFLSEYSLDLCEQNVNTLWCSLEIANSRLVAIMVSQYAKKELLSTSGAEFDFWYDKLIQLPMYFAKFDTSTPAKRIIEAIEHQITVHYIQHVVVDNVQVINTNSQSTSKSFDSYRQGNVGAEEICSLFRTLSTQYNVHVTIVVHPNRETEENTGITIGSLYGAVKASQSADNILIIQRKYFRFKDMYYEKFLQIWKNRFAGEVLLGERLQMYFDSRSRCHKLILKAKKASSKE